MPQTRRKRKPAVDQKCTYLRYLVTLPEEIGFHLLEYIEAALIEYSAIEEQLRSNLGHFMKHPTDIPKLVTNIPIDKGEIRPDSIDDW